MRGAQTWPPAAQPSVPAPGTPPHTAPATIVRPAIPARSPAPAPPRSPARGSAAASSPARGPEDAQKAESSPASELSSRPLLKLVQHLPNLLQLRRRHLLRGKRAQNQVLRRAVERALDQVARQPLLGLSLCHPWSIDVRPELFAALQQAFFRHHLHLLQHGGVAGRLAAGLVNVADGAGAARPEDVQDLQLSLRRKLKRIGHLASSSHVDHHSTILVVCQR